MRLLLTLAIVATNSAAIASVPSARTAVGSVDLSIPENWKASATADQLIITSPDSDPLTMLVRSLPQGTDPRAGLTSAGASLKACSYPLLSIDESTSSTGFDYALRGTFDLPPSSTQTFFGAALVKGKQAAVYLICGERAALDRRRGEISAFISNIHPIGWTPENFLGRTPHQWTPNRINALRSFILDGMQRLHIPGSAFAVLQDGKVVHEEGLGLRMLGRPERVNAHTRFGVASNSKMMTTLLLAQEVASGKIGWDTPVSSIMPEMRLADAAATKRLTVRHLICACTGLPRADLESYFVDPAADHHLVIDQLKQLKPTTDFGQTYQYSNTLAGAAGIIAGKVADASRPPLDSFNRAMRDRIFKPLGMSDTSFPDPRYLKGNWAEGYGEDARGYLAPVPQGLNATLLPYRATGSAFTSVHDLALLVALELNEGRLNGRQWVDRTAFLDRRKHGVSMGKDQWYGMGLMTRLNGGVEYLFHGGDLNGYHSQWIAIPGTGLGAVLLTSSEGGGALTQPFQRRVLELLYDGEPRAERTVRLIAVERDKLLALDRQKLVPFDPRKVPLAKRYGNPLLGRITVTGSGANTSFDFGPWSTPVSLIPDPDVSGGFSIVSTAPSTVADLKFIPGRDADGTAILTLSDDQHKYVYRAER